jgi:hypothetical protein
LRRLFVPLQNFDEVALDRSRCDILIDFAGNDVLGGLVDLDDLFNLSIDVAGEKVNPQKIFGR